MKTATKWGLGLGGVVALGLGAAALRRKPKSRVQRPGPQDQEGEQTPTNVPAGETWEVEHKGCVGSILHLPQPDEMGNRYFWAVHRGAPENTLVASGAAKQLRVAAITMWDSLRWQVCQRPVEHRTVPQ
jgi:hypothetical protein